jgi:hypothetical protein
MSVIFIINEYFDILNDNYLNPYKLLIYRLSFIIESEFPILFTTIITDFYAKLYSVNGKGKINGLSMNKLQFRY